MVRLSRTDAAPARDLVAPHPQLTKFPALITLEQRTQIPKTYVFLGGVALLALFHSINTFASPVSNLLGWAFPAYLSIKALESPSHADDIQWLTYWVVFGFFNFLESFALRAVLYYFPWYFAFKSIFILWLQLPSFRVRIFYYFYSLSSHFYRPVLHNILAFSVPRRRLNLPFSYDVPMY